MHPLVDRAIQQIEAVRGTMTEIDALVPDEVILRVRLGENVQTALDALRPTGGLLVLDPGDHDFALVLPERPDPKLITVCGIGPATLRGFYAPPRTHNAAVTDLGFINPFTSSHIKLGDDRHGLTTLDDVPSGFLFQRIRMRGGNNCRRGIAANCRDLQVLDSDIGEYVAIGQDSQAIAGWNGVLNHRIVNTRLEAAGENVMYGGNDAASEDMFPQRVVIDRCVFTKLREWVSQRVNFKCLLELKNVQDFELRDSELSGSWKSPTGTPQYAWPYGVAIAIKASNADGTNPTARTERVLIQGNTIRDVGSYIRLLGQRIEGESGGPAGPVRDIRIVRNHCEGMHAEGDGRVVVINAAVQNVEVDHNTFLDGRHSLVEIDGNGRPSAGVRVTNNIAWNGTYGYRNQNGSEVTLTHNAMQRRANGLANVRGLDASNIFYDDVRGDLSAHITSDDIRVGAGA